MFPGPPAPTNVVVFNATDTSLFVTWTAPQPPNGVLQGYQILLWIVGQEGQVMQSAVDKSLNSFNITGLLPHTTYGLQVLLYSFVSLFHVTSRKPISKPLFKHNSTPLHLPTLSPLP